MDYAMAEVDHHKRLWEYFDGIETDDIIVCDDDDTSIGEEEEEEDMEGEVPELDATVGNGLAADDSNSDEELEIATGGTRIRILADADHEDGCTFRLLGRSKRREETIWMQEVVTFLFGLQNLVINHIPDLHMKVMTAHKRGTDVFRGHPNFRGEGPWKDWAIVDWGRKEGELPSHIWCFVSLSQMPKGRNKLNYGGIDLVDGVYAVVEVAQYDTDAANIAKSDLFTPLLLEIEGYDEDGDVSGRKFYLANTDAIVGTCCVIPDQGGPKNAYFQVKNRAAWSAEFVTWLKSPHKDDGMEYSDEDSDEE